MSRRGFEPYHTKILRMAFEVPDGLPKEFDHLMAVLDSEQGCDANDLLDDTQNRIRQLAEQQLSD